MYTLNTATRELEVSRMPSTWNTNYMRTRQEAAPKRGLITSTLAAPRLLNDNKPKESELVAQLREEIDTLQSEKNEMIAELQKIAAEYKELVAAKQSLERQVEEEQTHSASLSEENAKLRQLVQKLRNNENVESEVVQEQVASNHDEPHIDSDFVELPTLAEVQEWSKRLQCILHGDYDNDKEMSSSERLELVCERLIEFKNAHCLPTSDQRVREKPQETIDLLIKQYELA